MLTIALGALAGATVMAAPHVHGEGQLDVAMEADGAVMVLLSLPGDTAVGFEHAPRDAQQREQIESARAVLSDSTRWLGWPAAAGCSSSAAAEVTVPVVDGEDHHHDKEHGHGHDDHAHDGHDHDDHDHHKHVHGDSHDADEPGDAHDHHDYARHSENWVTEVQAQCSDPDALRSIDLGPLFKAFPSLEILRVQFIGAQGQGGAELSAGNSVLELP